MSTVQIESYLYVLNKNAYMCSSKDMHTNVYWGEKWSRWRRNETLSSLPAMGISKLLPFTEKLLRRKTG